MFKCISYTVYRPESTYVRGKGDGDRGVLSASMAMHLMFSRTSLRTVVMDSYTLLSSSDLISICSKVNKTCKLVKQVKTMSTLM